MTSHEPNTVALPREIEEEIVSRFNVEYKYAVENRDRFSDMEDFLKEVLEEAYAAGVKAGLMEAREMVPEEETEEYRIVVCIGCKGFIREYMSHNSVYGYSECCGKKTEEEKGVRPLYTQRNEYRTEALARLDEKINSLQ